MARRRVSPEDSQVLRDDVERSVERAVSAAMRDYLADVERATLSGLASSPSTSLAASVAPLPDGEVPSLGAQAGRWAAGVDAGVITAIERAFARVWRRYTDAEVTAVAEQAMKGYLSNVRDRLVRGTYFGVTVYDESFDLIRSSLAQSAAEGWTRPQLAQRIAAELSWESDGPYWRGVKAEADYAIDAILDPIGPPGHPAREYARHNDPRVKALRADRNRAIKRLDAERSVWQTRAMLIARTESTGVANYGAYSALASEGAEKKMWLATGDRRTRPSHEFADGQEVAFDRPFLVGGARLMFPGDPSGPVDEVAACRCTMIG